MDEEDYERTVMQEFERVKDAWLSRESVTGIDVGYRLVGGLPTGQLAIRVYVSQKLPIDQVPPRERIPEEVGGVPVDVIEGTPTLE